MIRVFAIIGLVVTGCQPSPRTSAAPSASESRPSPPSVVAASPSAVVPAPSGGVQPTTEEGDCGGEPRRRQMAQILRRDKEFHNFVCEIDPCTSQEFFGSLRFADGTLRDAPRIEGCFVRPDDMRTETLTGVFALEPSGPRLLFTYYGIDIGPDPNWHGTGYRDLIGSARGREGGEPTWHTERFRWWKNNYR